MSEMPKAKQIVENPLSHLNYSQLVTMYLDAKNLSVRKFASMAGITRARLDKIYDGRATPTPDEMSKISSAMSSGV